MLLPPLFQRYSHKVISLIEGRRAENCFDKFEYNQQENIMLSQRYWMIGVVLALLFAVAGPVALNTQEVPEKSSPDLNTLVEQWELEGEAQEAVQQFQKLHAQRADMRENMQSLRQKLHQAGQNLHAQLTVEQMRKLHNVMSQQHKQRGQPGAHRGMQKRGMQGQGMNARSHRPMHSGMQAHMQKAHSSPKGAQMMPMHGQMMQGNMMRGQMMTTHRAVCPQLQQDDQSSEESSQ